MKIYDYTEEEKRIYLTGKIDAYKSIITLNIYIDDKDRYTEILDYNKSQLEFELNELDIRLRALRDKLENG